MEGMNGAILAYGQTASGLLLNRLPVSIANHFELPEFAEGKTFSISGSSVPASAKPLPRIDRFSPQLSPKALSGAQSGEHKGPILRVHR